MKYTEAILSHLETSQETVDVFAKRAGISRATLYRILRGESNPRLSSIESLLKMTGYVLEAVQNTPTDPQKETPHVVS